MKLVLVKRGSGRRLEHCAKVGGIGGGKVLINTILQHVVPGIEARGEAKVSIWEISKVVD